MTLPINSNEMKVDMCNSRINFFTSNIKFDSKMTLSLNLTEFKVDMCNCQINFSTSKIKFD